MSGDLLQPIFKSPDAANVATLPIGGGLVVFTLIAAGLMDRAGRVLLLIISAIGMSICSVRSRPCSFCVDVVRHWSVWWLTVC